MPIPIYSTSFGVGYTTDAYPRPPSRILPLSKGGDLVIDFLQMVDDVYVNYAPGVTVSLQIDTDTPIVAVAAISAYHAVCRVEFPVTDAIRDNTPWRVVVSYPTTPTTEVVGMNGVTARADT